MIVHKLFRGTHFKIFDIINNISIMQNIIIERTQSKNSTQTCGSFDLLFTAAVNFSYPLESKHTHISTRPAFVCTLALTVLHIHSAPPSLLSSWIRLLSDLKSMALIARAPTHYI